MQWTLVNGNYVAIYSFKKASYTISKVKGYLLATMTLIALSIFVALLTRLKFQRIRDQNDQFKKIKILTSNYELEVDPAFVEVFKEQQADRDFVAGKEGAITGT